MINIKEREIRITMRVEKYVEKNIPCGNGKRILITGANSGIGFAASLLLAEKGAELIFACRNINKAQTAKKELLSKYPEAKVDIYHYDQSSFASIESFVQQIKQDYEHLDAIVLNAGIYHPSPDQLTMDGYPLTIGTNYIGVYYLLKCMSDYLQNQKTKIIFVSSLTYKYQKIKKYSFLYHEGKKTGKSYGVSKICLAKLFVYYLKNTTFDVYLMHPGVASTNIFSSKDTKFPKWFISLAHLLLPLFTHSPKKASLGIVQLSLSEDYQRGTILGPRGLFEWCGYPKKRKLPKHIYQDVDKLMEETKNVIEVKK